MILSLSRSIVVDPRPANDSGGKSGFWCISGRALESVSHTTIIRWVLHYVPEYERRWARYERSPGTSRRMDETAVAVRGGRHYLYRAVDRRGKSVASLLCNDRGLRLLGDEDGRWRSVVVRQRRYLNNVAEQDHRAIKKRCAPMLGLKRFRSSAITLAGIELAHRIRKQQYLLPMNMKGVLP